MSSTRHAQPDDAQLHQDRFSSATEFQKGLLANLVAMRCERLCPADRELIWFLQLLSHREGLAKVAGELRARFANRLGPDALRQAGAPDTVITPAQLNSIRREIPAGVDTFPLDGEMTRLQRQASIARRQLGQEAGSPNNPQSYTVRSVIERSGMRAEIAALDVVLAELCTNPAIQIEHYRPWFFPTLIESLRAYMQEWVEERRAATVFTNVGKDASDALDFCLERSKMTLIEGEPGRGKSFIARAYCDMHPGQTRYVLMKSYNDDIGFFRGIAKGLGCASALSMKTVQLRDRIEAALQSSRLMLVLDDAQYCWPQANRREALPSHINWLMTALVNFHVPVALIVTPHFLRELNTVEKKTGWNSEQFVTRIGDYRKLPDTLSTDDMAAVARAMLPGADRDSIKALVLYGKCAGGYLRSIENAVARAAHKAKKTGSDEITFEHIKMALTQLPANYKGEASSLDVVTDRRVAGDVTSDRFSLKPAMVTRARS